jgi:hypothetical protein
MAFGRHLHPTEYTVPLLLQYACVELYLSAFVLLPRCQSSDPFTVHTLKLHRPIQKSAFHTLQFPCLATGVSPGGTVRLIKSTTLTVLYVAQKKRICV